MSIHNVLACLCGFAIAVTCIMIYEKRPASAMVGFIMVCIAIYGEMIVLQK